MISRIWHGWTSPDHANAYKTLLRTEIFEGIQQRHIAGFSGIDLLRRDLTDETEFVTIMWFESLDAVRSFAGADYEVAVVPSRARELLRRFDARSAHYEVRTRRTVQQSAPSLPKQPPSSDGTRPSGSSTLEMD